VEKPPSSARTVLEVVLLVILAGWWFGWGTGHGDLVKTETLRAIVAREMLDRDNWLVPTVHHRVYQRKPPLHAWTTATVATIAGRLDEGVARLPSVGMGVLYVVMMYGAGRGLINRRAGLATAALAAANYVVLDYGGRADLDMGLLTTTAAAVLCAGVAWRREGWRQWTAYAGAYAAALAGSLWKAPHVLIILWLTLFGLAWFDRRAGSGQWRRKLLGPANLVPLALCLAALAAWTIVLARTVGPSNVGRFAAIELFARLIPFKTSHFVGMLIAWPKLYLIALPASALAVIALVPKFRPALEALEAHEQRTLQFLLAWLVPNAIFLAIAPASASRYWLPVFPPIALLAVMVWRQLREGRLPESALRLLTAGLYVLTVTVGGLGLVLAVGGSLAAGQLISTDWLPDQAGIPAALVSGVMICLAAGWGLLRRSPDRVATLPLVIVLCVFFAKPVEALILRPMKEANDSMRSVAARIDALVPSEATIFLLSDRDRWDISGEQAEIGFYSTHTLRWPPTLEDALAQSQSAFCYLMLRPGGYERLSGRLGDDLELIERFPTPYDSFVYLCRIGTAEPVAAAPAE
jgi:4-amino-4-deoxy-L-arabinose transferase-like glycosyltransferase